MSNMTLGTYTFEMNPSEISDLTTPERRVTIVETFTSVQSFSWGVTVAGKSINLLWPAMSVDQYGELQTLLEADAQVEFDPVIESGTTYMVEIVRLNGKLHMVTGSDSNSFRKDVVLSLILISEV